MKLHYSQTLFSAGADTAVVLIPYEITLLSNVYEGSIQEIKVLIPYEITLLSNGIKQLVKGVKF